MGSVIGDYVHLTRQGYIDHGISKNGNFRKWSSQRSNIKRQAKKTKASKSLKDIEDTVKAISNIKPLPGSRVAEIQQAITTRMQEQFGETLGKIDFSNLTMHSKQTSLKDGIGEVKRTGRGNKTRFTAKPSTMAEKVLKLTNILHSKIRDAEIIGLKDEEVTEMTNACQEITSLFKNIYKTTAKDLYNNGWDIPDNLKIDGNNVIQLSNIMNEMITRYAKIPPISLQEGTLFEMVLAAAKVSLTDASQEAIQEAIKKAVQGDDTIKVDFDYKNFVGYQEVVEMLAKKTKVQISSSKDENKMTSQRRKVDVTLSWEDDGVTDISAKNVVTSKTGDTRVSLVTDSPLLIMVQSFNAQFINHYLNVYSHHYIKTKQNKYIRDSRMTLQDLPENAGLMSELKFNLFYTAMSGANFTRSNDTCNVFAIHDKRNNNVKLVYLGDLLSESQKNLARLKEVQASIQVDLSGLDGKKKIESYHYHNVYQSNYPQRITGLISELHQAKVHLSFKPRAILESNSR